MPSLRGRRRRRRRRGRRTHGRGRHSHFAAAFAVGRGTSPSPSFGCQGSPSQPPPWDCAVSAVLEPKTGRGVSSGTGCFCFGGFPLLVRSPTGWVCVRPVSSRPPRHHSRPPPHRRRSPPEASGASACRRPGGPTTRPAPLLSQPQFRRGCDKCCCYCCHCWCDCDAS